MSSACEVEDTEAAWYDFVIVFVLLILSGLFSGLNLGLMSLDKIGLEVVERSGTAEEMKYAKALMPVREQGNFLLCTLLLGNTLVNAVLAIFLANISGGAVGALITTFSIVVFGEIIPQSVCSRHGLKVGFMTRYIVYVFMFLMWIVAKPIAVLLDTVMGEEIGSVYTRDQLKNLIEVHSADKHGSLIRDEIALLTGALKFTESTVRDIMTPINKVFMLDVNDRLDYKTMNRIVEEGYSRVPVCEGGDIMTILLIKNLIVLDPHEATPVRQLLGQACCLDPYYVDPDETLDNILNEFQKGKTHMAVVQEPAEKTRPGARAKFENVGLLTLEDVIEALIQEEIADETDDPAFRKGFVDDYARFRSLNLENERHAHLPEKEVEAVSEWLLSNHTDIFAEPIFTLRRCKHFVRLCAPLVVLPPEANEPKKFLWQRGQSTDYCYLVLSDGPLMIHAGEQGFEAEASPLSVLGIATLTEQSYTPDFSIEVIHPVRLLKITRTTYQQFIQASTATAHDSPSRKNSATSALLSKRSSIDSSADIRNSDVVLDVSTGSISHTRQKSFSVGTSLRSITGAGGQKVLGPSAKEKQRTRASSEARKAPPSAALRLQVLANPIKKALVSQAVQKSKELDRPTSG